MLIDRYCIWTALTRATDLNNVTIFQHSDEVVTASENEKETLLFVESRRLQTSRNDCGEDFQEKRFHHRRLDC